jgi:hypothetical protein
MTMICPRRLRFPCSYIYIHALYLFLWLASAYLEPWLVHSFKPVCTNAWLNLVNVFLPIGIQTSFFTARGREGVLGLQTA